MSAPIPGGTHSHMFILISDIILATCAWLGGCHHSASSSALSEMHQKMHHVVNVRPCAHGFQIHACYLTYGMCIHYSLYYKQYSLNTTSKVCEFICACQHAVHRRDDDAKYSNRARQRLGNMHDIKDKLNSTKHNYLNELAFQMRLSCV